MATRFRPDLSEKPSDNAHPKSAAKRATLRRYRTGRSPGIRPIPETRAMGQEHAGPNGRALVCTQVLGERANK